MAAKILNKTNHNGWDFWYVLRNNKLVSINEIRKEYLEKKEEAA
jgi:site-specific DNA-methyltransferase (adenine-specific)